MQFAAVWLADGARHPCTSRGQEARAFLLLQDYGEGGDGGEGSGGTGNVPRA